jgi:hypothetical protein
MPLLHWFEGKRNVRRQRPETPACRRRARVKTRIKRKNIHPDETYMIFAISSKLNRGDLGYTPAVSPYPKLHKKFDFISVPAKNSASTPALLNPDIGPQSSPSARAARMK